MSRKNYERTKSLVYDIISIDSKMSSRKKIVSIILVILGIVVATPFNYMYGIEGIEVDLIWVVIGLLMAVIGIYTLKKESKG